MSKTIAAIIPLYNGCRYIEEAIVSVLHQDRRANEIIVVDDGSTDGGAGADIVRSMIAQHSQIRLLTKANGGQGSARNFGVGKSKSDLIALLDQDDRWYPNHLRHLEAFFVSNQDGNLGWVYSNLDSIDENGTIKARSVLDLLSNTEHPKRTLLGCLRGDMFVLPGASLVDRTAFEAVGGFDPQFVGYEDDDFFLRLFVAGFSNAYLNESLTQWRTHSANTSFTSKMARSRRRYFHKISAAYPEHTRHIIVPRFSSAAYQDYVHSTIGGNPDRAARAADELRYYVQFLPMWRRARLFIGLRVSRLFRSVRLQAMARAVLPKALRKIIFSFITNP